MGYKRFFIYKGRLGDFMNYEEQIRKIDSKYKGTKVRHQFVLNKICEVAKDAEKNEARLKYQLVNFLLIGLIVGFCGGLLYAL